MPALADPLTPLPNTSNHSVTLRVESTLERTPTKLCVVRRKTQLGNILHAMPAMMAFGSASFLTHGCNP